METTRNIPLNQDEATKIAGAFARLHELKSAVIKTDTANAEQKGLQEYLAAAMVEHASEFIGCWFAVRNEYEPLIGLVARISQRVSGINETQRIQLAAAQPKQNTQDGKIVALDTKG
jgi:hypothetical protein